jgi:hypothetical protein
MTTVCGVGLHTKEERGDEHYITPLGATESLIAIESHNFPKGEDLGTGVRQRQRHCDPDAQARLRCCRERSTQAALP